jgi:hypothetical protein
MNNMVFWFAELCIFLKIVMFWSNLPFSYSGSKTKPSMEPAEPGGKQGCTALLPKSQNIS